MCELAGFGWRHSFEYKPKKKCANVCRHQKWRPWPQCRTDMPDRVHQKSPQDVIKIGGLFSVGLAFPNGQCRFELSFRLLNQFCSRISHTTLTNTGYVFLNSFSCPLRRYPRNNSIAKNTFLTFFFPNNIDYLIVMY